MITDSILVEKWGTLEVVRRVVRMVFILAVLKLLKNEESFGESFFFQFAAKCFNRNFKYLF